MLVISNNVHLPDAEIELTEEHEEWLRWMTANQVQHIRLG